MGASDPLSSRNPGMPGTRCPKEASMAKSSTQKPEGDKDVQGASHDQPLALSSSPWRMS